MAAQTENKTNGKKGKVALVTCYVLFGIYFINVLLGKASISFDMNLPHFGNVIEFLLLSLSSILFIIAALKHEAAEN